MKNIEYQRLISLSLIFIAIVVFFGSAIMFGNYNTQDIWPRIVGALFGVVLSAIITMLLLSGQTRNALEKERNAEIFKEKLKIYQEYLHALCKILKDGEITSEEAVELQFLTSYISLHTRSKSIYQISANSSNIINLYVGEKSPTKNTEDLLKNLFDIVHCFRKELYPKDMTWDNTDINKTIEELQILEQVAV